MRLIQDLDRAISEFIDQHENTLLVIRSRDEDLAVLSHRLVAIEPGSPHFFHTDTTSVEQGADRYANTLIHNLAGPCDEIVRVRRAARAPVPPLPPECFSPAIDATWRFRRTIGHLTTWLPNEDTLLVLALLPETIRDQNAHAQFIGSLLPQNHFEAWMRRVRFILRDDRANPFVVDTAVRSRTSALVFFDARLAPEDIAQALAEDAANPDLEPGQRTTAFFQCAMTDIAEGRLPDAMTKLRWLYGYYESIDLPPMMATVLQLMGDLMKLVNRADYARLHYLQAIALACNDPNDPLLPVLSGCTTSLGMMATARGNHADAESWYDMAAKVQVPLENPIGRVDLLERLGHARAMLGNRAGAIDAWTQCAHLAREEGLRDYFARAVGRLREIGAKV